MFKIEIVMTTEQKAKAYDEAIERAKVIYNKEFTPYCKDAIENIFPELKDSEDERIRKALITFFQRFPYTNLYDSGLNAKNAIAWLEKQGEQKPAIHPKFKVGDWLVEPREGEPNGLWHIERIEDGCYWEGVIGVKIDVADKDYRLWTIADAKDGDVVVNWNNTIYLFKGIEEEVVKFYCYYSTNCERFDTPFDNNSHLGLTEPQFEHHPATKEQRSLLFSKIQENGYEWDAEKKELKTIGQKSNFKPGDWITNGEYTWYVEGSHNGFYDIVSSEGCKTDDTTSHVDEYFRLWTIQDAKDGDVVVDKSDGTIGIFQSIGHHPDGGSYNDPSYCFLHCRYDDGFFYADFEHGNTIDSDDLIPATKEQRDLLFQKMKKAGFEFDFERKELRKIEQEPVENHKFKVGDIVQYITNRSLRA